MVKLETCFERENPRIIHCERIRFNNNKSWDRSNRTKGWKFETRIRWTSIRKCINNLGKSNEIKYNWKLGSSIFNRGVDRDKRLGMSNFLSWNSFKVFWTVKPKPHLSWCQTRVPFWDTCTKTNNKRLNPCLSDFECSTN